MELIGRPRMASPQVIDFPRGKKDIHNTSTYRLGANIDVFDEEAFDVRVFGNSGFASCTVFRPRIGTRAQKKRSLSRKR